MRTVPLYWYYRESVRTVPLYWYCRDSVRTVPVYWYYRDSVRTVSLHWYYRDSFTTILSMDPLELEAAKASIQDTLQWKPSTIMIDLEQQGSTEKNTIDLASLIKKPSPNGSCLSSSVQLLMHKRN